MEAHEAARKNGRCAKGECALKGIEESTWIAIPPELKRCNFEGQSTRVFLSLNALKTTDAELTLMAMAAIIGDRRCPVNG